MKRITFFTLSIFAASLFLTAMAFAQAGTPGAGGTQEREGVTRQDERRDGVTRDRAAMPAQEGMLRAANDIRGMEIRNLQGEELGTVDQVMVDMQEGQVGYVVVNIGGVLGIGADQHAIPWNALQFDAQQDALTLDIQAERFRESPRWDQQAFDREQGRELHQFYGVSPYWEEQQQPRRDQQMRDQQMRQQQPGTQQPGTQQPGTQQQQQQQPGGTTR